MGRQWHIRKQKAKAAKQKSDFVIESRVRHAVKEVVAPVKRVVNRTKTGLHISRSDTTQDQITLRAASKRKTGRKPSMPKMPWDDNGSNQS